MLLSIEPTSFYGANRATLDLVRSIRLSRLTSTAIDDTKLDEKKKGRSRSNSNGKRRSLSNSDHGIRLFPGLKHGVKKPTKKVKKVLKERRPVHIRQQLKEKFDFSRTPYALPKKKPRVALNEESCQKRKFFKTTVQVEEPKKTDSPPTAIEFEDMNDIDEEPFANIKKDVSKIIHFIEWSDDEDCMRPQLTRKEAVAISNEGQHNLSYITPSEPLQLDESSHLTPLVPVQPKSISPLITPEKNINDENSENNVKTNNELKYYPIFTSPTSPNVLSDVTNKVKKRKKILIKAAAPNDQYQIDAGQKEMGPTECKKCKMPYDMGDPTDCLRHEKFHRSVDVVKIKYSEKHVVGKNGDDEIIQIQYSDPKPKVEKVHEIMKITEDEIGTGYSFKMGWKAFIYVRHNQVLGCVIAEPNVTANRAITENGILLHSEDSKFVKCGINRIWVKADCRGQKIATTIMDCLRKNFLYGEYLKLEDIAFSVTTYDGNEFAKKYTKTNDYLIYSGVEIESQ